MMRVINATYQLSEIRRSGTARQPAGESSTGSVPPPRERAATSAPETTAPVPQESPAEIHSLKEMLFEHFVREVRKRDRDGDGYLSRREHGGSSEEFSALDADRDGRVSAGDLTRAALDRNPSLRRIVAGPWTPIYEALLQVGDPTEENLHRVVREGAETAASERGDPTIADQNERSGRPVDETAAADSANLKSESPIERIERTFLSQNPSLGLLYERLQRLRERLGRYRHYHPIDVRG